MSSYDDRIDEQPDFVDGILVSNEAKFRLNLFVNRHDCRYSRDENPDLMKEFYSQYPRNLNVWAGLIGIHATSDS